MAEYYPLLSKAIASLPNSTVESRKLVYDRARKALIGQLRTLHPPVPDADIDKESVALDRAIERLEGELAGKPAEEAPTVVVEPTKPLAPPPPPAVAAPPRPPANRLTPPPFRPTLRKPATDAPNGANPPAPPAPDLRASAPAFPLPPAPRAPQIPVPAREAAAGLGFGGSAPEVAGPAITAPAAETPRLDARTPEPAISEDGGPALRVGPMDNAGRAPNKARLEPQRPFAPQPPKQKGQRRPYWIIPLGILVVVAIVGFAAWKLRDRPELLLRPKPAAEKPNDTNKIVQRVDGGQTPSASTTTAPATDQQPAADTNTQANTTTQAPANNPAAPVAGRAALLVEAPEEAKKVKTYLGNVVWRLDNVSDDQNQAVGLAVRADVDLPEDKLKVSVIFQKNSDPSLPASHTIKIRFTVESGSATGSVKQINVPQMRLENTDLGEQLDGVTVPIVENSFLVGLSPGNSETANMNLLMARQWIDIPLALTNGRIAKLTFEKTDAGLRDLQDAITAWAKQ